MEVARPVRGTGWGNGPVERQAPRPVRSHVANRCVDKVRRRVQNETLGHRGTKSDPLYRIRKLLLSGD